MTQSRKVELKLLLPSPEAELLHPAREFLESCLKEGLIKNLPEIPPAVMIPGHPGRQAAASNRFMTNKIVFDPAEFKAPVEIQAGLILHELIHVSQNQRPATFLYLILRNPFYHFLGQEAEANKFEAAFYSEIMKKGLEDSEMYTQTLLSEYQDATQSQAYALGTLDSTLTFIWRVAWVAAIFMSLVK
ncbi:MAG: hypothetical protein PHW04_13925 [Candidatus Wallbacteria bacterium]|nr:hypothetical protein [Candidatus Wallbacteria bacterium]